MDLKYKDLFSFFPNDFFCKGTALLEGRISEISEIINAFIYLFIFKSVVLFFFDYILAPVHQFACSAEGK